MTLKEELGILRGEPIRVVSGDPMDIPCVETSDPKRLCRHPVVSVNMITYNHEPYIRQAIEGVMMQKTDFEFELVIGEDCSTDKTREICFEYQRRHPDKIRVLWWHENLRKVNHPAGCNGARNRVHCRGEFIAFCEGDDYWIDPLKLQKQVDVMRQHPNVGLCFCGATNLVQKSGEMSDYDPDHNVPVGLIEGRDFLRYNVFGRNGDLKPESFVRTATTLIRNSALLRAQNACDILTWCLRLGDVPLWLSLASVSDVYFLKDRVSVYRVNDGGACARLGSILWKDNFLCRLYFMFKSFSRDERDRADLSVVKYRFFSTLMDSNQKNRYIRSYLLYFCRIRRLDVVSQLVDGDLISWWLKGRVRGCAILDFPRKVYRLICRHGEYSR